MALAPVMWEGSVQLARIADGVRETRSALIVARLQDGQVTARVIDDAGGQVASATHAGLWPAIAAAMTQLEERPNG